MTFSARLDNAGRSVEAHNAHLHLFYEHRVASLERYIAFCVMFHAMAKDCKVPWLCTGWNTARSQSNLRVATTGWLYALVVYRYCNTTITHCSSIFLLPSLLIFPHILYYHSNFFAASPVTAEAGGSTSARLLLERMRERNTNF